MQQNYMFPETRTAMKSPKRVMMKTSFESKELVCSDSSCFGPRSLFALPSDEESFTLESLHFDEDSSDQDLLLDVRSNSSFPQAKLLHPAMSFGEVKQLIFLSFKSCMSNVPIRVIKKSGRYILCLQLRQSI